MKRAEEILSGIFGYKSFRPLQYEIINNILEKKDTLVIMPTGGGKSLCYQIPSLIFEGLTVVISPLISLMKDQVMQLRMIGVDAAVLNSSISRSEYETNYKMVESGKAKMLYLAPESLGRNSTAQLLRKIKVDCIAVDEAHCISEWGHDFRKDYRQLGSLRESFSSAVCIGLTATATPKVQDDIISNLRMKEGKKFLGSFNRDNLFLQVLNKKDPVMQTIKFLRERKGQSGIIYCFSRAQVDELSSTLSSYGFSSLPYHAGMTDEDRNKNQEAFIKEEVDIIVATIAFGMGINKSNVRFVLHFDLPKNLESYYQEIGRAGRDGLKSDCLLLYRYADTRKIKYFIDQKENEAERLSAELHLRKMIEYADSEVCRRTTLITYFGEKYHTYNCGMCDNCVRILSEQIDLTIPAQKFLSAVKRTGEIYGAAYIADLLTAGPEDRIIQNRHNLLSVYGIGKEYNKESWIKVAKLLETQGMLSRELKYGSLVVTEKGTQVLKSKLQVSGSIKEKVPLSKITGNELFELLRKKRKEIAEETNVPPYVIFSDKTLMELSTLRPKNLKEMRSVHGIGSKKLDAFGDIFLAIIRNYSGGETSGEKLELRSFESDRSQRTFVISNAFNSGGSLKDIAELYKIKPERVLFHLHRHCLSGNDLNTEKLKENLSLPEDKCKAVLETFRELGTEKLSPIHERFSGSIKYIDLHILRIIFLQQNKKKLK